MSLWPKNMNEVYLFVVFIGFISIAQCVVFLNTKLGRIKGLQMTSRDGRRFNAFLGIPFAKPPVGDLRFKVISSKFLSFFIIILVRDIIGLMNSTGS